MDRCIQSLLCSYMPTDILVLDNLSADKTVERLRTQYPQVEVIENGANLGFGAANNIGMRIALNRGYDSVLLLNQDAWAFPTTIASLAAAANNHHDYAILSPVHLTGSGDDVEHGFAVYSRLNSLQDQPQDDVRSVEFIDAAIWYMPIMTLKRIGFFSSVFTHYGEDRDFANRVLYHGYKIGWLPRVYGCHDRERRQVTKSASLRAERVYHLSEYTNIRLSWFMAFALGPVAAAWKGIKGLSHFRFRNFFDYLFLSIWLLIKTPCVFMTRRKNKHPFLST